MRAACLTLPETSERLSHGGPAFLSVQEMLRDVSRTTTTTDAFAIWCAAPDGVQAEMVETEPDRFRPPYVGHLGWLGVSLQELRLPSSGQSAEKLCDRRAAERAQDVEVPARL